MEPLEEEEEEEEEVEEQENVDGEEELPQKMKKKKRVKRGPRGLWKQDLVDDLVDIIIISRRPTLLNWHILLCQDVPECMVESPQEDHSQPQAPLQL